MMKTWFRRGVSLLLCLMLIVGMLPFAWAAEGKGSFYLAVMTKDRVLVEPEAVSYTPGQSIAEALKASKHVFTGIEDGIISAIDGVDGTYYLSYDATNSGYSLEIPASEITTLVFSANVNQPASLHKLIAAMGEYNTASGKIINLKNDPDAKEAYERALNQILTMDDATATERYNDLNRAIEAYRARMEGPTYTIRIQATQNGTNVVDPTICLRDTSGNCFEGVTIVDDVPAGTYTYCVSDSDCNRTEGQITVDADQAFSVVLPFGAWFAEVELAYGAERVPFTKVSPSGNQATWKIEDCYAGALYINAAQGVDIPDQDKTRLYAIYTDIQGDEQELYRSWENDSQTLPAILADGIVDTQFRLEARYTTGDTTMIQSFAGSIVRTPTLRSLQVLSDGKPVLADFSPLKTDYELSVATDSVQISAQAFCENAEISYEPEVALSDSVTKIPVTVYSANGQSTQYTLNIQKARTVEVQLEIPEGIQADLYNAAGAKLEPGARGYALIPGESYTCVSTKDVYYHATSTISVTQSGVVTAPVPKTEDLLSSLEFHSGSSTGSLRYAMDTEFTPTVHSYRIKANDYNQSIYVWAETVGAETVNALYSSAKTGIEQSILITDRDYNAGTQLPECLTLSGAGQILTIRLTQVEEGICYEQDYEVTLIRQTHLNALSCAVDGQEVRLTDETGQEIAFSRAISDYYLQVSDTAKELTLQMDYQNEGRGYLLSINGGSTDLWSHVISLEALEDEATAVLVVSHEDENSEAFSYTLHIRRVHPVLITFELEPEEALVFLRNTATKREVPAVGKNAFELIPGVDYTYTATASGYIGQEASYIAPQEPETVQIHLKKAPTGEPLEALNSQWPSFRQDQNNNAVVDAPIPTSAEDAVLYWSTKLGDGWAGSSCGHPILVDGYLYIYAGTTLYKIDALTGKTVATGEMDHTSSFSIMSATYGGGMIFVGLANGSVQAFNAETLQSLWIYKDPLGGQPNSPIVYRDGYVYTGFWLGEALEGSFVCLNTTDEDPAQNEEKKLATWTYTQKGGFYWAGAYVNDSFVLVGTDDGEIGYQTGYASLLAMDPRTGRILSQMQLPDAGDIRSSILYDEQTQKFYFTNRNGYFYGVEVDGSGQIQTDTLISIPLLNESGKRGISTSTPVAYQGRAYVGVGGTSQFGAYSGHNISVIDLKNCKVAYTVPTQGFPQTSGVVTSYYSSADGTVYVYFFDNYYPGKLRIIQDKPGQSRPVQTIQEISGGDTYAVAPTLFTPYDVHAQHAICSPIVDENGTIYFKNDTSYLMAVGSTVKELKIVSQPKKLTYQQGETFDPEGLKVMAEYTNGTEWDVTDALLWSSGALQPDDTIFQLVLPMGYQDRNGVAGQSVGNSYCSLSLQIGNTTWNNPFTDVSQGWYYDAVRWAVESGITTGITKTEFKPDNPCTRGQIVTFLWRAAGEPEPAQKTISFTDVAESSYCYQAVLWAVEQGVTTGITKTEFKPNNPCTRAQAVTFLHRAAGEPVSGEIDQVFQDVDPEAYYGKAVLWAVDEEITNGTSATAFSPGNPCKRSQIVTFLYRARQLIQLFHQA